MSFEMIHCYERDVPRITDRLRKGASDEERANKAGTIAYSYCGETGEGDSCLLQCLVDNRNDHLDMSSRGKFWHNTAIPGMDV